MNDRNRILIIGGLIGAAIGATAAWAYSTNKQTKLGQQGMSQQLRLHASGPDYVKLGIATLALMRQVTDLFRPG